MDYRGPSKIFFFAIFYFVMGEYNFVKSMECPITFWLNTKQPKVHGNVVMLAMFDTMFEMFKQV